MNDELTDTVTAAADLGRRDAERMPNPYALTADSALVVARVRSDESVRALHLERFLSAPLHARGEATLHDPTDFAAYVTRLADGEHTTVWADLEAGHVDAVLDDHADNGKDGATAGWRAHRVSLRMQDDPDWATWLKFNDMLVGQVDFAEHIEQMTHTIVSPSAADMLEFITSFHAKRNVTFSQQVNVLSGDLQLTYDEDTKTGNRSGQIEVPKAFTVRLSPWLTVAPVDMTARLRHRIEGGRLAIGYSLLRPDRARQAAFNAVIGAVSEGIGDLTLQLGTPPAALNPLS